MGLISLPTTTLPTYYILPTFYLISTYNFHWGMDALTEVGVNVDDPKNVLVPDLLRRFREDVLRSTRNDLFESAKASGLVHPKDILVKRIKRAIGPSLAEKYAADIFELCYALRNKSLIPRLKNKNTPETCSLYVRIRFLKLDELCETSLSALY